MAKVTLLLFPAHARRRRSGEAFDLFYGIPYSHDIAPLKIYEFDRSGQRGEWPPDFPRLQQKFYVRAERFIEEHDTIFVVEQNRDAQLRSMLVNELEVAPARLVPILHFDGTPITARFIVKAITQQVHQLAVAGVQA